MFGWRYSQSAFIIELLPFKHLTQLGDQELALPLVVRLLLETRARHKATLGRAGSISALWANTHVSDSSVQILTDKETVEIIVIGCNRAQIEIHLWNLLLFMTSEVEAKHLSLTYLGHVDATERWRLAHVSSRCTFEISFGWSLAEGQQHEAA